MRTEASAFQATPLTVWVGPMRYVFHPGRDVIVGRGSQCDIPLDRPSPATTSQTARPDLVLRFTGTHWVAIDRSPNGIFVNGARMSTVDIRNGQAITIGDPQRGPRLIFNLGPSVGPPAGPPAGPGGPPQRQNLPPPPRRPQPAAAQPNQYLPTERATQRMRIPAPEPPKVERPVQPVGWSPPPPTAPVRPPPPAMPPVMHPPKPPIPDDGQPRGRGLIERMTDATRKLRAVRPESQSDEANATSRLPLEPGARTVGVAAHWLGLTVDGRELLTNVSFTA